MYQGSLKIRGTNSCSEAPSREPHTLSLDIQYAAVTLLSPLLPFICNLEQRGITAWDVQRCGLRLTSTDTRSMDQTRQAWSRWKGLSNYLGTKPIFKRFLSGGLKLESIT